MFSAGTTGEDKGDRLEYPKWLSLKGFSAMDSGQEKKKNSTEGLNNLLLRFLDSHNVIIWKHVA